MIILKRVKWAEIVAVLLVGLNLMLLGLPGAVFVELLEGAVVGVGRKIPSDSYWPMAIYVSMLMPVGFLFAIMRGARVRPGASVGWLLLWGLGGAILAGIIVSTILIRLAVT